MKHEPNSDLDVTTRSKNTVGAVNPAMYYEPFVKNGRVGYRCVRIDGDQREVFVYLNPSTDAEGTPNVFVYVGEENDPAVDPPVTHIVLEELV